MDIFEKIAEKAEAKKAALGEDAMARLDGMPVAETVHHAGGIGPTDELTRTITDEPVAMPDHVVSKAADAIAQKIASVATKPEADVLEDAARLDGMPVREEIFHGFLGSDEITGEKQPSELDVSKQEYLETLQ